MATRNIQNEMLIVSEDYDATFGPGAFFEDYGEMPEFWLRTNQKMIWKERIEEARAAIERGER